MFGKGWWMGARRVRLRAVGGVAAALLVAGSLGACKVSDPVEPEQAVGGPFGMYVVPPGIHKIKHVIIVMQENRSFDSYFGTYPGADGIPMRGGIPAVCVPVPGGGCRVPYHDRADVNGGGPHAEANAIADVDGGRMDGFISERRVARTSCHIVADPACAAASTPDVMGYHTGAEIPNYWTYASDFALDDHMFEPVKSWSLPERLYLVSGGRPGA
jgi:phospholipase C